MAERPRVLVIGPGHCLTRITEIVRASIGDIVEQVLVERLNGAVRSDQTYSAVVICGLNPPDAETIRNHLNNNVVDADGINDSGGQPHLNRCSWNRLEDAILHNIPLERIQDIA